MTEPSEEELTELIHAKTADELSDEEIGFLRRWVVESPELRAALGSQPRARAYFDEALARLGWPLDRLLAELEALRPKAAPRVARFRWFLAGAAVGMTVVLLAGWRIVYPAACQAVLGRQVIVPPELADVLDRRDSPDPERPAASAPAVPPVAPTVAAGAGEAHARTGPRPGAPEWRTPWAWPEMLRPDLPGLAGEKPLAPSPAEPDSAGRHPVVHEWVKEGYNLWAEIKSGIEQQAWPDVAQLVFDAAAGVDRGLVEDLKDADLLIPFGTMLVLLMEDHPPLRESLRGQFGERAALRAAAAMASGDPEAVEAVAVGLWGTEAAVEAHRWLGDRALARGAFSAALGHYHQALRCAAPAARAQLDARARMAAALVGRDAGQPAALDVQYGDARLGPRQFESLVADLIARRSLRGFGGGPDGLAAAEIAPAPPSGRYEARKLPAAGFRAEEPSNPGRGPSRSGGGGPPMTMTAGAGLHFVADGAALSALDPASGAKVWSAPLGDGDRYGRKGVAARPVSSGGRVAVREGTEKGLVLKCFDAAKGGGLWSSDPRRYVVSDPLVRSGAFVALALAPQDVPGRRTTPRLAPHARRTPTKAGEQWRLWLTAFDADSGEVREEWMLLTLADEGKYAVAFRAAARDETIVAVVSGGVVCLDAGGRLLWVRRTPWTPDAAYRQAAAPVLGEGRVFVALPAAGTVLCLDLGTGRRAWQAPVSGVARLIGTAGERLVAEDEAGLVALDVGSGQVAWRHAVEDPLEAIACGAPGGVAYCRLVQVEQKRWRPELVWLDPATGEPVRTCRIEELDFDRRGSQMPAPGPLMAVDGRIFLAFRTPASGSRTRELAELLRVGDGD